MNCINAINARSYLKYLYNPERSLSRLDAFKDNVFIKGSFVVTVEIGMYLVRACIHNKIRVRINSAIELKWDNKPYIFLEL